MNPVFQRQKFFQGRSIRGQEQKDIAWFSPDGNPMNDDAWNAGFVKCLGLYLDGDMIGEMNERGEPIDAVPLTPSALAGLIGLIDKGTISSSIAKEVFAKMYDSGRAAQDIVAAEGLAQIGDEDAVLGIVRDVIARHADAAAQYRAGKNQTFGFLVGQVMKGSGGKANPKLVNQLLKRERDRS